MRNIGLFGMIDVVRSRDALRADGAVQRHVRRDEGASPSIFRDNGLYTMLRWNGIHTNPPLTITEEELAEGFDIIDRRRSTSRTKPSVSRATLGTGSK